MPLAILAAAVAAPALYVSDAYGVSFKPPPKAYICPLPSDWVGTEHGVPLYLEQPLKCGDVGYASTERAASPSGVPRIEVHYGFAPPPEDRQPAQPACPGHAIVREAWVLGQVRPICRSQTGQAVRYSIDAVSDHQWPGLSVAVRLVAPREPTEDQFMDMLYVVASLELCGPSAPHRRPCAPGGRF